MRYSIFSSVLAACAVVVFLGCASSNPQVSNEPVAVAPPPVSETKYKIKAGDRLDVKFFYNPELDEEVIVRPDGYINLQLIDEVEAAGLETMELDRILTDLYSRELKNPVITVIVREFGGQRVYVGGEVDTEGLLSLTSGLTAFEAIVRAGGFLETADPAETLVIRKDAQSRPVPIRVNLSDLINGKQGAVDFRLASDDIVFVPKSAIAEANKFVNQYIERLLLFRGVSFGFSYSINDND